MTGELGGNMEHGPWEEIRRQRRKAIDNPATSIDDLADGFIDPYFSDLFDDSKIPLSYYTKACAWASDYPLTYRRAMVYLNPGQGHLADFSFEEYVVKEFGCTYETFERLVEDGWLVVLLDVPSEYDRETRVAVSDLFDSVENSSYGFEEVRPRYVSLVDVALGAGVASRSEDTSSDYVRASEADNDFVDIDATIDAAMDSQPWTRLDGEIDDLHGVGGRELRKYVTERALKIRLAGDALGQEGLRYTASNIEGLVESGDDDEELVRLVYTAWNHVGTPIFYSDKSGDTDLGPGPADEYQVAVKKLLESPPQFSESGVFGDITDEITRKVIPRATGNLPKEELWFERSAGGADIGDVLSLSPSTDASLSELRTSRADEHQRYYEGIRDTLQQNIRNGGDRDELVQTQNSNVHETFGSASTSGRLGDLLFWTGLATSVVSPVLPVSGTAVAGTGMKVGQVVTNWWRTSQPEGLEAIPRPTRKEHIDLGRINSWRVPYRGTDDLAADGGQFGMGVEPGKYVTEWEAV